MFICQVCGIQQGHGKKPIKKVVEYRDKVYPKRFADPECKICIDNGGHGREIVKEIDVCEECACQT